MKVELIIEELKKISLRDIIDLFLNSNYFTMYFIVYCFYVCYYLRIVAPIGGLSPCRSFILGLTLAYSPRFIYSKIVHCALPEMDDNSVFLKYAIVWVSMNLCPFDLVFQIVRNVIVRTLLQLFSTFGYSLLLNTTIYQLLSAFPGQYQKVLFCCIFAFSAPCFIDFFDSLIFGKKRDLCINRRRHYLMFYPFHWIKRLGLIVLLELVFSQGGWILPEKHVYSLYKMKIPVAIITTILSIIDLCTHQGNPFFMFDFIFPKTFDNYLTYYPAKECQGVHDAKYTYKE